MDLLGVGPLELIFILLIIFLVLGPQDMAATSKKIGRFLRTVTRSETWLAIKNMGDEIRKMPTKLMREAEIESYLAENPEKTIAPPARKSEPEAAVKGGQEEVARGLKAWTTPPKAAATSTEPKQEQPDGKEEGEND
jgi:Sec-independent protein translocase protein TatA